MLLNETQLVKENIETVYIYHNEVKINAIINPQDIRKDLDTITRIINDIQTSCADCNSFGRTYIYNKLKALNKDYNQLTDVLHHRIKRGLLNIIGSASKALFGTLDDDDLTLINKNIDQLFDENNKLSEIIQNQTATFKTVLQSQTIPRFIQESQLRQNSVDKKVHNLELLLTAETIISDIRENIDKIRETIVLGKQGIIMTELLSPHTFIDAYEHILKTHMIISHIPAALSSFQILIDISSLKMILSQGKIIYQISVPILEDEEWTHVKLYPIPQRHGQNFITPIPKYDHLLYSKGHIIPIDQMYLDHFCKDTNIGKTCKRTQPTQQVTSPVNCKIEECSYSAFRINQLTFIPMHAPNTYIVIPEKTIIITALCDYEHKITISQPIKITSSTDCTILYDNNVMKFGGTTYEANITVDSYSLPENITNMNLDQLKLPTIPIITPNFNRYEQSLDNINLQLRNIVHNHRIKSATEITVNILTYAGYVSLGFLLLYVTYRLGILKLLGKLFSKIVPNSICIKIFCQDNYQNTGTTQQRFETVRYSVPSREDIYLEELSSPPDTWQTDQAARPAKPAKLIRFSGAKRS